MSTAALSRAEHGRSVLAFLRHLGEMTVAMFLGMFAFALALGITAGAALSGVGGKNQLSQPTLSVEIGTARNRCDPVSRRARGACRRAARRRGLERCCLVVFDAVGDFRRG